MHGIIEWWRHHINENTRCIIWFKCHRSFSKSIVLQPSPSLVGECTKLVQYICYKLISLSKRYSYRGLFRMADSLCAKSNNGTLMIRVLAVYSNVWGRLICVMVCMLFRVVDLHCLSPNNTKWICSKLKARLTRIPTLIPFYCKYQDLLNYTELVYSILL